MGGRFKRFNWEGLGVVVLVLIVWQILVTTKVVKYSSLPGPIDIWHGLGQLTGPDEGLWAAVRHTIGVVLLAWIIGTAVGALLGMLMALNRTAGSWASATVDLLRSLPTVALIPIAILVWGTGEKTEVILGAYAALWPMLINTAGAVRNIPPRLRDVASTLRLNKAATVRKIVLPAAGAPMLVGARLSLATTLVVCVVSEMLGMQSGVGNQLVLEQSGMQPARMWVYVLLIGVLGLIANAGLVRAFRVVFPGVAALAERSSK